MLSNSFVKKVSYISILALSLIATAASAGTYEKSFDVKSGGELDINTDVGSIQITTHSEPTILLSFKSEGLDEDDFTLDHKVSNGDLTIIGEMRKGRSWYNNVRAEFKLTIPVKYSTNVKTSGGSISLKDLVGDIDLNTSGGSLYVEQVTGDVELHTSGGSITTESIYGEIDAHTSGGSISLTMDKQPTEDAKFTTSGGSITAYLVSGINLDINASSSGGRVKSEFNVNGRVKRSAMRGEINSGGPDLKLHTSGGSISIKEL